MTSKIEHRLLQQWGFKTRSAFEGFLENSLKNLEGPAENLKQTFEKALQQWIFDYLKGQRGRFVARIEPPPPIRGENGLNSLLKNPSRLAEKILHSWQDFEGRRKTSRSKCAQNPSLKHDPQKFLKTIPDIVRFRIICNYLKDLRYIDERLRDYVDKEPRLKIKNREDHIFSLFPCSRAGHRAIEYTLSFRGKEARFLFEVQIMTQLQHAWDKKDHHLIYEHIRAGEGDQIPVQLKNRVAAMSELLYAADTIFDELLKDLGTIKSRPNTLRKKDKKE
jgi:ppGpp synthetase/RelA/SpoT-type nucleotidyltranferase